MFVFRDCLCNVRFSLVTLETKLASIFHHIPCILNRKFAYFNYWGSYKQQKTKKLINPGINYFDGINNLTSLDISSVFIIDKDS